MLVRAIRSTWMGWAVGCVVKGGANGALTVADKVEGNNLRKQGSIIIIGQKGCAVI